MPREKKNSGPRISTSTYLFIGKELEEYTMVNTHRNTTIAALSTAPGNAGIAIVRLSGQEALAIAEKITAKKLSARVAHFCHLYEDDAHTLLIDQAVVLFFPAPASFTGEDVVELQTHGSPLIVEKCLQRLYQLGADVAQAGEFSERAFLNNKMDLTQAESIMDLIHASSTESLRIAQQTLHGKFSLQINDIADQMLTLRANIELALDFPDEEIDFIDRDAVLQTMQLLSMQLQATIDEAAQGKIITEGIRIVIAGEPNVGKSTLLNSLLGKNRAIVSSQAGTTRDVLSEHMLLEGMPIHITDTAGIRDSENVIEKEGIRRAKSAMNSADLILLVTTKDRSNPIEKTLFPPSVPCITLINKCDLYDLPAKDISTKDQYRLRICAQQEWGIDLLKEKIKEIFHYRPQQTKFSARVRSIAFLRQSKKALEEALASLNQQPELSAESLKLSHQALQYVTGKIITDDILEVIFREFCIGK